MAFKILIQDKGALKKDSIRNLGIKNGQRQFFHLENLLKDKRETIKAKKCWGKMDDDAVSSRPHLIRVA